MKKVLKTILVLMALLAIFVAYARKTPSTVHVEHTFNAPVARVWAIWTDTELMKKWWGPKDFTAPVIKNDFRVGGTFLLSMRSDRGEMYWNAGRYLEIVPNQKIVSQLSFADQNGRIIPAAEIPVPGVWPEAIQLTIDFTETDGKTLITVEEAGVPLIMKILAKIGWRQQFEKFEKLL